MVEYEKNCFSEYVGNKETKFVFNQPNNEKLSNIVQKLVKLTKLLYLSFKLKERRNIKRITRDYSSIH